MSEEAEIKKIQCSITSCTRNVNNLKKIIEVMITDSSIYTTQFSTLEKSLIYIDNNINILENLFLVTDSLAENKETRKRYVILIETTIADLKEFKHKLNKIRTHSIDMKELSDYLENTRI